MPRKPKKAEAPPKESDRKPMIAQLRGSAEYKEWVAKAARFDNRSIAGLIERALVRYMKEIGFPEEAPER